MSARDKDAIAVVYGSQHRVGGKYVCRCEDCRAVRRVCVLAQEGVALRKERARAIGRSISNTIKQLSPARVAREA